MFCKKWKGIVWSDNLLCNIYYSGNIEAYKALIRAFGWPDVALVEYVILNLGSNGRFDAKFITEGPLSDKLANLLIDKYTFTDTIEDYCYRTYNMRPFNVNLRLTLDDTVYQHHRRVQFITLASKTDKNRGRIIHVVSVIAHIIFRWPITALIAAVVSLTLVLWWR
jgi:hypothetical protein